MNVIVIVLVISMKIYIYRFNVQDNQYLQSQVQTEPFTYSFTDNSPNTVEGCQYLHTSCLGNLQEENAHSYKHYRRFTT